MSNKEDYTPGRFYELINGRIVTNDGVYELVPSDHIKGSSCSQCDLQGYAHCEFAQCCAFGTNYHFVRKEAGHEL